MTTIAPSSFWSSNIDFQLPAQSGSNSIVTASVALPVALQVDPSAVTGTTFRSWTPLNQYLYLEYLRNEKHLTESPVVIGPAGGDRITARMDDVQRLAIGKLEKSGPVDVYRPVDPLPASQRIRPTAEEFAVSPNDIDPKEFLKWNDAEQLAWIDKNKTDMQFPPLRIQNSKGTLYTALIRQVTVADLLPYQQLPGSAAGAQTLSEIPSPFPKPIDGVDVKLPVSRRPEGFDTDFTTLTDPTAKKNFAAQFATWPTGYQLEYVQKWGTALGQSSKHLGLAGEVTADNPNPRPVLEAFVSSEDKSKLIIPTALDKAGVAQLSLKDQNVFVQTLAFASSSAAGELSAIGGESVKDVVNGGKKTAAKAIEALENHITAAALVNSSNPMPTDDKKIFLRELKVLKDQLATMAVISPDQLNGTLTELKTRFDRALTFWDMKLPTDYQVNSGPDSGVIRTGYVQVIDPKATTLSGSDAGKGYAIFIAQEKRAVEMMEGRMKLAAETKKYDAPTLIYMFQASYNNQVEALVVAETEAINQQNALLKIYARMQDVVNRTLAAFEKADGSDKKRYENRGANGYFDLTDEERRLLSMFDSNTAGGGNYQRHPVEKLANVDRPRMDFVKANDSDNTRYDLRDYTSYQWTQFSTRLNEAVTQINQNSQLQMNKVNSLDKERNRHFELANSALSKMSEMLQNIARS